MMKTVYICDKCNTVINTSRIEGEDFTKISRSIHTSDGPYEEDYMLCDKCSDIMLNWIINRH